MCEKSFGFSVYRGRLWAIAVAAIIASYDLLATFRPASRRSTDTWAKALAHDVSKGKGSKVCSARWSLICRDICSDMVGATRGPTDNSASVMAEIMLVLGKWSGSSTSRSMTTDVSRSPWAGLIIAMDRSRHRDHDAKLRSSSEADPATLRSHLQFLALWWVEGSTEPQVSHSR